MTILKKIGLICFIFIAFVFSQTVFAQQGWEAWNALPTQAPPNGSVPPSITTSNIAQSKVGTYAAIGINRVYVNGLFLAVPGSDFALFSDTAMGSFLKAYSATPWTFDGSVYGFDTNAPIRVGFVVGSTGQIYAKNKPVIGGTVINPSYQVTTANGSNTPSEAPLCADVRTGTITNCKEKNGGALSASLSVSPKNITENTNSTITVRWSSIGATKCYATEGGGFSTNGSQEGSDMSNVISMKAKNIMNFTMVCSDEFGNYTFASDTVYANAATSSYTNSKRPIINFTVSPINSEGVSEGVEGISDLVTTVSLSSNGGGPMTCTKSTTGQHVWNNNAWSGLPSGSSAYFIPGTAAENSCKNGCKHNSIISIPDNYATLNISCYNNVGSSSKSVVIKLK